MTASGFLELKGLELLVYAFIYNEVEVNREDIKKFCGLNDNRLDRVLTALSHRKLIYSPVRNPLHKERITYAVREDILL